jgi:hypothetical protein
LIALHLVAEQAVGLGVVARDAQDQAIAIEDHPDFGLLRRRLAVVGIPLQKIGGRQGLLPDRFVRRPVDDDRFTFGETVGADFGPG